MAAVKFQEGTKAFIGIGYLVITIIVLANFLSKKPEGKARSQKTQTQVISADSEALRTQLNEERRLNQEMKNMLQMLQNAFKDSKNPQAMSREINAQIVQDVLENGLPEIAPPIASEGLLQRLLPVSGKNPYLPFYRRFRISSDNIPLYGESGFALKIDKDVPFLLRKRNISAVSEKKN